MGKISPKWVHPFLMTTQSDPSLCVLVLSWFRKEVCYYTVGIFIYFDSVNNFGVSSTLRITIQGNS